MLHEGKDLSITEKLLEELRTREDLRKALAEELLPEIIRDRKLRTIIVTSISREVATKEDVKELREDLEKLRREVVTEIRELRSYVQELGRRFEGRIDTLEQRVTKLEGMMSLFVKLFIAFNVPLFTAVIGILLKMVWT